uniref:F-box domain-containing protein n=1 Tax=Leersia perrieri TaxID=77586 RepID=A0A0D9WV30_9ORYZ
MAAAAPAPAPELANDVMEEILLRLPPDDPTCAARASAFCKHWRNLLTNDAIFRRRYAAFHRTPPVLGFIHPWPLDCRHGLALFLSESSSSLDSLTVWDPISGDLVRRLHLPPHIPINSYHRAAAIVSLSSSSASGECPNFGVVFVAAEGEWGGIASAWLYSSETGEWTPPSTIADDQRSFAVDYKPSVVVGDAVYFLAHYGNNILRYDLIRMELTEFSSPEMDHNDALLMTTTDHGGGGVGLGLALTVSGRWLEIWSWNQPETEKTAVAAGWVRRRVIELYAVFPYITGKVDTRPCLIGFAEGTDVIFMETSDGVYGVELTSLHVTRVLESCPSQSLFPYMSFFFLGRQRDKLPTPKKYTVI